ncbi:hypothetical protein [Lutibacter sp.]|uniref:hypothetical protein n=1 Tax=Lutibacter sp. TaxID=1925666 RepID=UPI003566797F
MKKTLIICLLILSNSVFGQIPGRSIEGPIVLFDTLAIKQGDIIYLGKGSDPDTGNFIHLYIPKNKTVNTLYNIFSNNDDLSHKAIPQRNLDKDFADKQLLIESFSKVSSKKRGDRILGVINMKKYQFVEGVFFNDIAVDFEPAIRSGEIIKISSPELLEEEAQVVELLFSPFEITQKGIEPVVVAINNLSSIELYNKTLDWTNSSYIIPNQATITAVPDEKIEINDFAKNVPFGTIMGMELFADLPYLFVIDFTDGEIRMTFTLGGKNGDITDENGEVIANISPSHMFNKKGEVLKMSKILKEEAEKIMNDLSHAVVDYILQ